MNQALQLLNTYFGYSSFRKGQEAIIQSILDGNDVVAIMPTGGGKSICYQIPALLFDGITVVISPLISLMKDQVDSINEVGIPSAYINSSLYPEEIQQIYTSLIHGDIKILYVAPERLESLEFVTLMKDLHISQVAVDEAHCVSTWGHDFRSSYRYISRFIKSLSKRPIVTAFTATATTEVRDDIVELLELEKPIVYISGFDRENLELVVETGGIKKPYILSYLKNHPNSSGIIYAATRKNVDMLFEFLKEKGFPVTKYHAGLSDEERNQNQEDFVYDRAPIMVATTAFGMGIDKSNIRFVIHYNLPKNIEGYYQEIGRAGRDGLPSTCILLYAPGDVQTQKYIIDMGTTDPNRMMSELSKLQTMVDYVFSQECHRKYILEYFGDTAKEKCGNCSVCNDSGDYEDRTEDAQKVLSCVHKMNQMRRSFGTNVVIDVLRGSASKKIQEFGLTSLSTYGIMRNISKDALKEFINTLIAQGLVNYGGAFPVLTLNQASIAVLKGEQHVMLRARKTETIVEEDTSLFEKLRAVRYELAHAEGVAPYMVFSDQTLKELSARMPVTTEQFLDIGGVGALKAEKFGSTFIEAISKYIGDEGVTPVWEFRKKPTTVRTTSGENKSGIVTIETLRSNPDIVSVCKERGITLATVLNHIYQYIQTHGRLGFELDLSGMMDFSTEALIVDAISKFGQDKLKPLKENLPAEITYDQIKAVCMKCK